MIGPLPPPFQQGRLDELCGLYAVINAVRLVTCRRTFMSAAVAGQLFQAMFERAASMEGPLQVFKEGASVKCVRQLLDDACRWADDELGQVIDLDRPFAGRRRLRFPEAAEEMREMLDGAETRAALVIGTDRHWTVARSVTARHIMLYDSTGISRWSLQRCRFGRDPELPFAIEHVIEKKSVFKLTRA